MLILNEKQLHNSLIASGYTASPSPGITFARYRLLCLLRFSET